MMKHIILILLFQLIFSRIVPQNLIHFRVGLSDPAKVGLFSPDEGDSVIIRGSFNGWTGNDFVLSDENKDGIYQGTFELAGDSGVTCEYKYLIKKAQGKALWEKKPNPQNKPHGSRVIILTQKPQEPEQTEFDFDKYYLAEIGKDVIFSVEEMQLDFQSFRETLEKEHCCLYDYTTKSEFDELFDQQLSLIDRPMRPHEFYKILTPITAKIGCGHTAVWMPGGYWDIGPEKLFPLKLKIIEGNTVKFTAVEEYVVVTGTYTDSLQLPWGSVIQEINGRPVSEILEEMRTNYSADAFNVHFIDAQIERRFPLIYARRFGFPEDYVVKYALPGRKTSETKTLIPATNQAVRKVVFSNFKHPPLEFELIENKNTAILTIPTFIYYDRVPYFTGFIDSSFSLIRVKEIKNLILDLRGNDGGDPFCAAPLFSYLQPEPLPYFAEPYGKYLTLADSLPIPDNHFSGQLITLMDSRCFSTNAHFCALLKYHKIGTIVGTESGATYSCNAGKNGIKVLDNTGIQLYFGRGSFAVAVKGMDKSKPIRPDYFVTETYQDFLDGKDKYMLKAFQLIEGKNRVEHY